jgi:Ca-activated chloride channel family protein
MTDDEVTRARPAGEEAGFGSLATAQGHLPLKAMHIDGQIEGLLAHVTLCQTFVNTLDEALEATYIFPLPDRMAVSRFQMEVAGREIEGVLRERGAARREYAQALRTRHRAAITEEDRPGVFTIRVGNLPPGEEATVRLSLVGPLAYSDGEATFRFPLVVAPRYIPGRPLPGPTVGDGVSVDTDAVPDASRITPPVLLPGYPNPVRLSLALDVHPAGLPLGEFRCSLHAVLEGEDGDGVRRILLQPGERLNRDFILRFRVGDGAVRTALALRPDANGSTREGTFALTIIPPNEQRPSGQPRDVVFVLDRSGSMSGWKMVAARRALARMVDTLTDQDRFTVLAFDDRIETPPEFGGARLTPAQDRNRFRAVEFLARVDARSGTEMAQPLDLAVHMLSGGDPQRERILVLVTDGQVGNEDQILRSLGERVRNIRIFALGIDQAVNAAFLRRLADLGKGACELVESEDRLDEVMAQIHRRLGSPVLTGLRLEPSGFEVAGDTLVPGRMPDLLAGAPLCVWGRYHGAPEGTLVLQAQDATGRPWSVRVPTRVSRTPAITTAWARGHVRELEDRFVITRENRDQLEKRILETSLRYGVLCRFTAFVAVDRAEVVNESGRVHRVTQAVEAPAGWDMLERTMCAAKAVPTDRPAESRSYRLDRVRRPRVQITYDVEALNTVQPSEGTGPPLAPSAPATAGDAPMTVQPRGEVPDVQASLNQAYTGQAVPGHVLRELFEVRSGESPKSKEIPPVASPMPESAASDDAWEEVPLEVMPSLKVTPLLPNLLIVLLILLALVAGFWYLLG